MYLVLNNRSSDWLINELRLNKQMAEKVRKSTEDGGSLILKGKKIEDVTKPLYRNGVSDLTPDEINFFLYLSNSDKLLDPRLEIKSSEIAFEFELSETPVAFSKDFKGAFNFSTRGFINTDHSSLLVSDEPEEFLKNDLSSVAFGLVPLTFSPVDSSKSGTYKHLNLALNGKSAYHYLCYEPASPEYSLIVKVFDTIFGKKYVKSLLHYIETMDNRVKQIDGYSKQVLMPYGTDYISISPMFNHHVLGQINNLKYESAKVANLSEKLLGGTQPGNISYTNQLQKGESTQFNMSFPSLKSINSRSLFVLGSNGVLVLKDEWPFIEKNLNLLLNPEVPNENKKRSSEILATNLVKFANGKLEELWSFKEDFTITKPLMNYLQSVYEKGSIKTISSLTKTERAEFLANLIFSSLRRNKKTKEVLTEHFVSTINNEVITHA